MTTYQQNEWFEQDSYRVRVGNLKDEMISEKKTQQRSVRIEVQYENRSQRTLKYVTLQWLLYDTDGYSYSSTILRKMYGGDAIRKLPEGRLNPGKSVRGWVAFEVPKDAKLAYVQFRANFMADAVADVYLGEYKNAAPKKEADTSNIITCPYCGVSHPEFQSFCAGCGSALSKNTSKASISNFLGAVKKVFKESDSK